jgi:hypothetical protein
MLSVLNIFRGNLIKLNSQCSRNPINAPPPLRKLAQLNGSKQCLAGGTGLDLDASVQTGQT